MIENHRTGLVWKLMRRNPHLRRGLERAGFQGGWLEQPIALLGGAHTETSVIARSAATKQSRPRHIEIASLRSR
jgi:hypothetical protein